MRDSTIFCCMLRTFFSLQSLSLRASGRENTMFHPPASTTDSCPAPLIAWARKRTDQIMEPTNAQSENLDNGSSFQTFSSMPQQLAILQEHSPPTVGFASNFSSAVVARSQPNLRGEWPRTTESDINSSFWLFTLSISIYGLILWCYWLGF
ncbi:uncharacterized protein BJX67DRAFT_182927 [Aspergillus lucknowensis]|uniref:Uncharacterized protein n=1 Tax=Aspergillus lucknowensis TaxID=176173 RepID=A0ABR4LMK6_9EURO